MLDLNRNSLSDEPINELINGLIEHAEPPEENMRQYLGASAIGSECLRKIQFDWLCAPTHPTRIRDVFARGHFYEDVSRQHFRTAGFIFAPPERLEFKALDGLFRGHADGIFLAGPDLPGIGYPCLWEHKAMNAKNWRAIARDGLDKAFPHYAAQVQVYQAYSNVGAFPAIFTVTNADTCERLHLLAPFDAERAQHWSDRAILVIEATRGGALLPRLTDDLEDWRCKICGHTQRCRGCA